MEKIFYISRSGNSDKCEDAPDLNRFRQMEKLNMLVSNGWSIKEMKTEGNDTYFILEKN